MIKKLNPPIFAPKLPILIPKPEHHSVSDWDFTAGCVYALDTAQYVSAPRCLRVGGAGGSDMRSIFLCRTSATRNLPQGRVSSWHRGQNYNVLTAYPFRSQAPLGSATIANMYIVTITFNSWDLSKYVGGVLTPITEFERQRAGDTWYHDRVTWWNGVTPENDAAITVMLESYIEGEWVQQDDWVYDTDNLWKDSAINRCGIGSMEDAEYYNWIDDTEIWAPE